MPRITFQQTGDDEAVIRYDSEPVGDLYRHEDPITGEPVYLILLAEDWRGWYPQNDRSKVRQTIIDRLRTHPLQGWRF